MGKLKAAAQRCVVLLLDNFAEMLGTLRAWVYASQHIHLQF